MLLWSIRILFKSGSRYPSEGYGALYTPGNSTVVGKFKGDGSWSYADGEGIFVIRDNLIEFNTNYDDDDGIWRYSISFEIDGKWVYAYEHEKDGDEDVISASYRVDNTMGYCYKGMKDNDGYWTYDEEIEIEETGRLSLIEQDTFTLCIIDIFTNSIFSISSKARNLSSGKYTAASLSNGLSVTINSPNLNVPEITVTRLNNNIVFRKGDSLNYIGNLEINTGMLFVSEYIDEKINGKRVYMTPNEMLFVGECADSNQKGAHFRLNDNVLAIVSKGSLLDDGEVTFLGGSYLFPLHMILKNGNFSSFRLRGD
jgi:hypothetical protein